MKKVIHIYKTYKPFTQGGIEEYIHSIISYQNSKFDYNLLSIGNVNHTSDKVKIFKKSFSFNSDIISFQLFFYLFKKVNRKKVILHLHTPWPSMELFLNFLGFENIVVTYHSDIIRQKFINFFYKKLNIKLLSKDNIKKIIVTSKVYYETSKILMSLPVSKIKIIPIGIGSLMSPLKNSLNKKKKNILFIGSNRTYKGIDLLKRLIKEKNFNVLIIGSNLKELKKFKNVKLYENVNEVDKEKILSDSYLLLMTSTSRNEAFGIVLVEALRSGIPIISPKINSGVSWINKQDETGYQYDTKNFDDMCDKINKLMKIDEQSYIKMINKAQIRYERYFKLSKMIIEIEKVYSSIPNN